MFCDHYIQNRSDNCTQNDGSIKQFTQRNISENLYPPEKKILQKKTAY